jgi:hypothetical protein
LSATNTDPEACLAGILTADADGNLILEVREFESGTAQLLASSSLQAEMSLGSGLYRFETRCAFPAQAEQHSLWLTPPTSVSVVERRKSRRRRFREQTQVTLRATSQSDSWRGQATLLNLSMQGVACKVSARDTAHTAIGQVLHLAFALQAGSQLLELTGRVTNVTETGSPNHAVVGMEFVEDDRLAAAQEALKASLDNAD